MRDLIISEIKRLAAENGGMPPGRALFSRVTGITPAKWAGVYWATWGDALGEAGFAPNTWNQKLDSSQILSRIAPLCRRLGRLPTSAEIRLERRRDPSFPAHSTVSNHFRTNAALSGALREMASRESGWADLLDILPATTPQKALKRRPAEQTEGMVYLLKSGQFYKIGKSEDIERRFRQIRVALPETVKLVHTIRTDDPSGIEAYWHHRFADKRANGEWFALSPEEVKAFCSRTYQ